MLFPEVFILLYLRGAVSVSIAQARLTGAQFAKYDEIRNLRVDSIGVTKLRRAHLGSADSKGVTWALGAKQSSAPGFLLALAEAVSLPANIADDPVC
jgi:hypothetical protein